MRSMQTKQTRTWVLAIGLGLMLFALVGGLPALADCHASAQNSPTPRSCCSPDHLICRCHHAQSSRQGSLTDSSRVADCSCSVAPDHDSVSLPMVIQVFIPAAPVAHAIFPMGPPPSALLPGDLSFLLSHLHFSALVSPRAPPFQG